MRVLRRCYFCRKITNPFNPNRLILQMYYGDKKGETFIHYMCKRCATEYKKIADRQSQELRERIAKETENVCSKTDDVEN